LAVSSAISAGLITSALAGRMLFGLIVALGYQRANQSHHEQQGHPCAEREEGRKEHPGARSDRRWQHQAEKEPEVRRAKRQTKGDPQG
jgi:hypothetical protein